MRVTSLFVLAASIASVMSDAPTVENDITQRIAPQATILKNDVDAYPASGLTGALAIHNDFQNLIATVNNATNDVESSGSFSEADGTTIVSEIQELVPTFSDTLNAIGAQASDWTNVPGGQALVLSDLQGLNETTIPFIDAITAASPVDLVPALASIKAQFVGGFSSAIAAYSS